MTAREKLETAGLDWFRDSRLGGDISTANAIHGLAEVVRTGFQALIEQGESVEDVTEESDSTGLIRAVVELSAADYSGWVQSMPAGKHRDVITAIGKLRFLLPEETP